MSCVDPPDHAWPTNEVWCVQTHCSAAFFTAFEAGAPCDEAALQLAERMATPLRNAQSSTGVTVLRHAVEKGFPRTVATLIFRGAP
jgi:hypothetical protein